MIYDSWQWKKELLIQKKKLSSLSKHYWSARRFEKNSHKIDLTVLTSVIIIRKLIESDRLSGEADSYNISVKCYSPRRHIDKLHNWVEDGDYEWGNYETKTTCAKIICNSLIHSYVYSPVFSEKKKLIGFFVVSDYDRNKLLYMISIQEWINYMMFVASDNICEVSVGFDTKKDDFKYKVKKRGNI